VSLLHINGCLRGAAIIAVFGTSLLVLNVSRWRSVVRSPPVQKYHMTLLWQLPTVLPPPSNRVAIGMDNNTLATQATTTSNLDSTKALEYAAHGMASAIC